jgi:hypothetical protein
MRCSASPTICIVRPASEATSPQATAAFSEVLFRLAFRPLAQPLGFYGDVVIDACARALARTAERSR